MKNSLTILGTGTCELTKSRLASSVLIQLDGKSIIFDLGRGISSRIADLGIRQDQVEDLIISHFHPDHLSDLIPYLHAACWSRSDSRTKDLNIYGPIGLENQLFRLLSLFGPNELLNNKFKVRINELSPGVFDIGSYKFDFVSLPPANNHGIKFSKNGKTYGITGDSYCHSELIEFMKGLDLVILDAGHSNVEELISCLALAQPHKVFFSHLYSDFDITSIAQLQEKYNFNGQIIIAEDLMVIDL